MPEPNFYVTWRRTSPDLDEQRATVPMTWFGWGTIHLGRVQYTPPWGCAGWWLPSVHYYRGGDEYCNNTLLIQLPLLGHAVFWKPWGRLRTTQCEECQAADPIDRPGKPQPSILKS
jgi:hypothetical protein